MIVPVTYPASEFHPTISPVLNLAAIYTTPLALIRFALHSWKAAVLNKPIYFNFLSFVTYG